MTSGDFRKKIKGAFELSLLFGRGIEAFSGEKRAALRSFLIPLALLPLNLVMAVFYPPRGLHEGYGPPAIVAITGVQMLMSFGAFVSLVFLFARAVKKSREAWLFFEAANWTGLATFVLSLPFFAMAIGGGMSRDEMDRAFIVISLYFYIVTACIANRSFRLNWQLAGFIGALALMCDQTAWDLLGRLLDIPYTWDY